MSEVNRKLVVVTGATGGLGKAICERAIRDGYYVLAVGRDFARFSLLADPGSMTPLIADLTDPHVGAIVDEAISHLPLPVQLCGIVHAAGISVGDEIEEIRDEAWDEAMTVNAGSAMRLVRSLVPRLKQANGASVVFVASPVALIGARKVSYAASKAALLGLNAALALQLGKHGIRVNALLPGPTITGMTQDWDAQKRAQIAAQSPLGRLCTPDEAAAVVSFLLGADASALTGTIIDATGGRHIGL